MPVFKLTSEDGVTTILEWVEEPTENYQLALPTRWSKSVKREYRIRHRGSGDTKNRQARDRRRNTVTYIIEGETRQEIREIMENITCPIDMSKPKLMRFYSPASTRYSTYDKVVATNVSFEHLQKRPWDSPFAWRYTLTLEEIQEIK